MKNLLNLKRTVWKQSIITQLRRSNDGRTTVERRSWLTSVLCIFFLLTLGVGQMWGYKMGGTTLYVDNYGKNWSSIMIHMWNGDWNTDWKFTQISGTDYWSYNSASAYDYAGYLWATENYSSQSDNITADGAQSSWYTKCYSLQNNQWTVPGQKSVSYTRNSTTTANTLAGSGTSGSPYIIKPGTAIGVELSGTAIDANCTKYYKFGSSAASTANTKQVVASCVAGTTYSMQGYTGAKRDKYESRYASAGTLYFKAAYTISAAVSGENGSVSITSGGNYVYTGNTSFTVTATPDSGYEVDTWTVTGGTKTGSGNSITVSASNSANCTVTVTFRAIPLEPYVTLEASKTTGINVGETITITATAHNTSATNYQFKEGSTSKQNGASANFSYTPTTVGNKTINVIMTYAGGTKEASIDLTLNTPSVALAIKAGSANNFYLGEGSTILKATPSNVGAGVTPSYVFTDQIGVTSASQTGTEWPYNPSVSGQAKARTMKVTMSVGGSTYTATVGVSVYEHFTVHIKNTDSWSGMYVYMWNESGNNGKFPGVQQELWNGSDLIYNVVLDTKYTKFIISQGNDDKKSGDISMLAVSNAGNCYTTTTGTSLPAMTCPAVPSVTTTAASNILNTSATLGCNITNLNRDNASEYGYYYSTSSTLSSANATTVGTKVKIGDRKTTTGNKSKSQTGLSANTTYYVIAYATNCAGTGWGSTVNFTTLSQTTVSFNTHGGSAVSNVTAVKTQAMPAISAPTRTGYTFNGMYDAASEGTKYYTSAGASARTWDKSDAEFTLHAQWAPITYSIHFNGNGATSGEMSNQGFIYDEAQNLTTCGFTKTGYTFGGWADSQAHADAKTVAHADGGSVNNLGATQSAIVELYAIWNPNTFTVNFNANGGTGTMSAEGFTYDATEALPTNRFTRDGYHFDGWATASDGEVIYADGAEGCRISATNGATVTLYAQWTRCEITGLTFEPTSAAGNTSVSVTANISPTPISGNTVICWKLYNNSTLTSEESTTFTPESGSTVTFTTPATSGTYYVQATLRTGSSCGSGDVISTLSRPYAVASAHTVTVRYMCDGVEIASRTEKVIPAAATYDFDAPDITGYTFSSWTLGDVLQTTNALTANPITVSAVYDGVLTANYTKKNMIYFNNTLGWTDVWVYFYNDASGNEYWVPEYGTGANQQQYFNYNAPYYHGEHGNMTRIEGTDIWYFDYQAAGYNTTRTKVAFANKDQSISKSGASNDEAYFHDASAIYRTDFDASHLSMFVPLTTVSHDYTANTGTKYYNYGYWMNYPESTGYTLKIYNKKAKADDSDSEPAELQSIPFTFTSDYTMPMKVTANLEAGKIYGFKIYSADDKWYGNNGTMTANTPNWELNIETSNCGLHTTAAGDYTFDLYYADYDDDKSFKLRIGVKYPVAANDYRIVYTDVATWSNGVHTSGWYHPSDVITRNTGESAKRDTVSFFWAYGSTPALKYQTCSGVSTGSASWSAGTSVDVSSFNSVLKEAGVYNFIFEQPAGGASISLVAVEPYSGKFYIRTDMAGNTKWSDYKAADHQMTYSEYADKKGDYTHYFMAYAGAGKNVKFVVANDYSPCISDTLVVSTFRDGDASHIYGDGYLIEAANIRFMWSRKDNHIARAYLAAAKEDGTRFLVLQGEAGKLLNENGTALSGESKDVPGNNHGAGANAIQFTDKENWMYETTIQVKPSSYVKLYAHYHDKDFYFQGKNNSTFDAENAYQLIGGSSEDDPEKIHVVYDFKTDRLISAWMPRDGDITSPTAINADIMILRNHQNSAKNITFNGGSLSAVKVVYGVMQFNRWTLNNRDGADDLDPAHCDSESDISTYHPMLPANEWLSDYERFNYYISFPFKVKVGEIFGFGTYGTHWVLRYYDGLNRAKNGYWIDSDPNWKYITNTDFVLNPYEGYLLSLSPSRMAYDNTDVWKNNSSQIELYFPSSANVGDITAHNHSMNALGDEYKCTINRGNGTDGDRRVKDSYWRCIGVPGFADYSAALQEDEVTIEWQDADYTIDWETKNLGYIYEWVPMTNSLRVVSGTSYAFKAMHAYLVQYPGVITWTNVNGPRSIVASQREENPARGEWKLTIEQNEKQLDQTYIRMSNDEEVTTGFDFGTDLAKEFNTGRTNIYTLIGYEQAAANCLPFSANETTVVPVGLKINEEGTYTIALRERPEGIGATLIDTETGVRTNLTALTEYTVSLTAGDYTNRFYLQISPKAEIPTEISNIDGEDGNNAAARKLIIDGVLYIVRDGKMFDARGNKVK